MIGLAKASSLVNNKGFLRIKFVPDATALPPTLRDKQVAKQPVKKQKSTGRLASATTRSMPSSPAVGASRSPAFPPPTSAPIVCCGKTQKMQALRTSLIHLLAARQVTVGFLARETCCSPEECREVLEKVGQCKLGEKWNLNDKSYKELDVWGFPYPDETDRQVAIDRAVSAFDRMRISREENLWQKLLPNSERGKGKILSKLNLHSGSFQKSSTPRISVQTTDDSNQGEHETGNDSDKKDRLAPNDAQPMARSKSHDQITKKKVSEREAQSKRLLAKNPKKVVAAPKPKEAQSTVKRGTKKAAAAAAISNPKSKEFVHDSDEDEDIMNVDIKPTLSKTPPKEVKKAPNTDAPKPSSGSPRPRIPNRTQKKNGGPLPKPVGNKSQASNIPSSKARKRLSESSQSSVSMTKSLSRISPHKPSPLGSSPPTNASDFDNDALSHIASSTSSTPLAIQSRIMNDGKLPANDRTAPQAPSKVAEVSPKRKADEIDSGIHNSSGPLTNGQHNSAKRSKASILSPPPSDSNSSTATTSRSNSPPSIRTMTIDKALHFKTYWAKYEKLHRNLAGSRNPSEADLDNLFKMHERLVVLKDEIAREVHMETRNMVGG